MKQYVSQIQAQSYHEDQGEEEALAKSCNTPNPSTLGLCLSRTSLALSP
jgi:hypothetical protein